MTANSGGDDIPLAHSPDGSRLLLDRADPSRGEPANHALFVAPIGGAQQPHRITPWGYTDDYASYSPDGRTIVFGTSGSLYRVSPEGRGLAKIRLAMPGASAGNAFDVSFSPDGQKIIFSLGSPEPGSTRPASTAVLYTSSQPVQRRTITRTGVLLFEQSGDTAPGTYQASPPPPRQPLASRRRRTPTGPADIGSERPRRHE